ADAVLTLSGDARALERVALEAPAVSVAEPRLEVLGRLADEQGWQRVTLVVVEDYADIRAGGVFREDGARAPGPREVLVDRASLTEVDLAVGDSLAVELPGETPVELVVSGLAHDPGRTPAWMFGNVVAYVTPSTLAELTTHAELSSLLIRTEDGLSRQHNRDIAESTAAHLEAAGATVTDIAVPVPGEHPASGVMG